MPRGSSPKRQRQSTTRAKGQSPARAKAGSTTRAKSTGSARATAQSSARSTGLTFRQLYAEAQRRDIKGRSSMDKAQLERVLASVGGKRGK